MKISFRCAGPLDPASPRYLASSNSTNDLKFRSQTIISVDMEITCKYTRSIELPKHTRIHSVHLGWVKDKLLGRLRWKSRIYKSATRFAMVHSSKLCNAATVHVHMETSDRNNVTALGRSFLLSPARQVFASVLQCVWRTCSLMVFPILGYDRTWWPINTWYNFNSLELFLGYHSFSEKRFRPDHFFHI